VQGQLRNKQKYKTNKHGELNRISDSTKKSEQEQYLKLEGGK
jgi:hypothetical protein